MKTISHKFVDLIPKEIESGLVYISLKYNTMVHLCCCGCNNKVVTPLSPTGWSLKYDGDVISIKPSIGNWNFPCRSHYWISESSVVWSYTFGDKEIESVRYRDNKDRTDYLESKQKTNQTWIAKLYQGIINRFNN